MTFGSFNPPFPLIRGKVRVPYATRLIATTITIASILLLSLPPSASSTVSPSKPPPPPPPPTKQHLDHSSLGFSLIVFASFLFFICFCIVYCFPRPNPSFPSPPTTATNGPIHPSLFPFRFRSGGGGGRGLDPASIDTFPIVPYAAVKAHHVENQGTALECAVCLNEFDDDQTLRLIPVCDHAFHPHCIDPWLRSHSTCPVCRADLINSPAIPSPRGGTSISNVADDVENVLVFDTDCVPPPARDPFSPIGRTEVDPPVVDEGAVQLPQPPPLRPTIDEGERKKIATTQRWMTTKVDVGSVDSSRQMERPIINRGELNDDVDVDGGSGSTGRVGGRRRRAVLNRYWSHHNRRVTQQPFRSITKLFRSKSTGELQPRVREWESTERFTLRVPEEVRNQIMSGRLSPMMMTAAVPTRGGSGSGRRRGRRNEVRMGRRHSHGSDDRYWWSEQDEGSSNGRRGWMFSLTPPFFSRTAGENQKKRGESVSGRGRAANVMSSGAGASPLGWSPSPV